MINSAVASNHGELQDRSEGDASEKDRFGFCVIGRADRNDMWLTIPAILLIGLGLWAGVFPRSAWAARIGRRRGFFKDADPTEAGISALRLGGSILAVIGIAIILYIVFLA